VYQIVIYNMSRNDIKLVLVGTAKSSVSLLK
jgi:hypothetical protein